MYFYRKIDHWRPRAKAGEQVGRLTAIQKMAAWINRKAVEVVGNAQILDIFLR